MPFISSLNINNYKNDKNDKNDKNTKNVNKYNADKKAEENIPGWRKACPAGRSNNSTLFTPTGSTTYINNGVYMIERTSGLSRHDAQRLAGDGRVSFSVSKK